MLHPVVFWYWLNGMGTKKMLPKSFSIVFTYIPMRKLNEMVYEYFKNKNLFHRNRYAFPKASNIKYIWAIILWGLRVWLNHPHINFKKTVYQKKCLDVGTASKLQCTLLLGLSMKLILKLLVIGFLKDISSVNSHNKHHWVHHSSQ